MSHKHVVSYKKTEVRTINFGGCVALPKNVTFPENQTAQDWTLAEKTVRLLALIDLLLDYWIQQPFSENNRTIILI